MFICDKCGKSTQPREKMHKVTVETRDKEYVYYKDKVRHTSEGQEIVKEVSLCDTCIKTI